MFSEDREFLEELRRDFVLEAEEYLQVMVQGMLDLEKSVPNLSPEVLESIYRAAHSLKGASQAVQMPAMASICQVMESVFSNMKKELLQLSEKDFDILQEGADLLSEMIAIPEESQDRRKAELLAGKIEKLLEPEKGKSPSQSLRKPFSGGIPEKTSQEPPQEEPELSEALRPSSASTSEGSPTPEIPQTTETGLSGGSSEMIRIRASKLDSLLLRAEELISLHLTLGTRIEEIEELLSRVTAWKNEWERLLGGLERPSRKETPLPRELSSFLLSGMPRLGEIHEQIRHTRKALREDQRITRTLVRNLLEGTRSVLMLPFSSLLQGFPKIFRNLAKELGKEAELFVLGGDVEVDKRILEGLKDPLVHLLRNSVDHGLELPAERRGKGKRPLGTVAIHASHVDGNRVELLVQDDGRGIDTAKLRENAVKAGILSSQEASALDETGARMLLFRSGISTSPLITDISGRGLGMAIVQQKVEALGGTISIDSTPGRGTTFRISLPLTLATFRGVLVEERGQIFVLPSANVARVGRIPRKEIKILKRCETIRHEEVPIPLVSLGKILDLSEKFREPLRKEIVNLVVLSSGSLRGAFGVDRVVGEQEVLLKPLGRQLQRVRNVSGATVLGSGKVVPVLNPTDLLLSLSKNGAPELSPEPSEEKPIPRILVAEDSLTSRTLLRNVLAAAGFYVETAVDGQDAWEKLQQNSFDLVVSDVEMPRRNGFELTQAIRSSLGELPVILVTSLESREDREKGVEAGANAYILKSGFDQKNLLDTIGSLL